MSATKFICPWCYEHVVPKQTREHAEEAIFEHRNKDAQAIAKNPLMCPKCNHVGGYEDFAEAPKLSPSMQAVVDLAKANGGKLLRYKGGFWARAGWLGSGVDKWFSTHTIKALVSRGVAEYSDFKCNGSFAVEITIKQ